MLDRPEIHPELPRPLMRAEYDRLVDQGLFEGEHIELIEGELVEMSPEGPDHADVITRLNMLLVPLMAGRALVRVQHPLAVSHLSEPEPDLAIVEPVSYRKAHPNTALLVIEVAYSSLRKDLSRKPPLYAAAGVLEYWVVDLANRVVHAHTDPVGGRFQRVTLHQAGAVISPTALPDVVVRVSDLVDE